LLNVNQVQAKLTRLQSRYAGRDSRMRDVMQVRQGDISKVFPGMFAEDYPRPLIANMIEVAARDIAETQAPLPSFNCSASNISSDIQRKYADTRTHIAEHYVAFSDLQLQMYEGADWYNTYGMIAGMVEMDLEHNSPRIRLLTPWGLYPELDRFGRTLSITQVMTFEADELASMYPEFADQILNKKPYMNSGNSQLTLVRYHDADQDLLYLPDRANLTLSRVKNPLGKCMARVRMRPTLDGEQRGQFDEVLGVQLARARFAVLQIQAAEKSIQAPIAIPQDVQELALGPDSIMRSANPQSIRRVSLDLPPGIFAESQVLERELRLGTRYPETRTGNTDASVITGRGVQELSAGFDTQIRAAQAQFARLFTDLIALCFEVDEKIFGDMEKTIRGSDDGTPFVIKYKPNRDIKGDYTVDVSYGLMAGLDPNRAIIALLQMRGDKLVSREFARREIPVEINVMQEEQAIDIEEMRDSLRVAVAQYAQAIPMMASNGADPTEIITRIADVIKGRQKGKPLEVVVGEAFKAKEQPAEMMAQGLPGAGAESLTAQQPLTEQGSPVPGQPQPGQAAPGGQPDLAGLLASLAG
jgi:hypothetical protein